VRELKFEIFLSGDKWIARDHKGGEFNGDTPDEALTGLLNEDIIRSNLALGKTCSLCVCGHECGNKYRCDLWDDSSELGESPPEGWEEYNEPGNTCKDFFMN